MTVISNTYIKNTINIQINVQRYMIILLGVTVGFSVNFLVT